MMGLGSHTALNSPFTHLGGLQFATTAAANSNMTARDSGRPPVQKDVFSSCWTPQDSWKTEYFINNWIDSKTDGSEEGDSAHSSTSSNTQSSPKEFWPFEDNIPGGLFNTAPAAPNSGSLFGTGSGFTQAGRISPPKNISKTVEPAAEYSLIQELLKLNLGAEPPITINKVKREQQNIPQYNGFKEYKNTSMVAPCSSPSTSWGTSVPTGSPQWGQAPPTKQYPQYNNMNAYQQESYAPQNGNWTTNQEMYRPRTWLEEPNRIMDLPSMAPPTDRIGLSPEVSYRQACVLQDLQLRLDECCEEYRQLEKERKQTEAELARQNLGKKISSSNGLPIPRLPAAPSRVDRLVVDFFREHARISTLLVKMEQLRDKPLMPSVHHTLKELLESVTVLQTCRSNERTTILQQLRGESVRYNEQKEALMMTHALVAVRRCALRARAANWCSLIWTLGPEDPVQAAQVERLVHADFSIGPPPIRPRPLKK